jgi:hypothetical protein
VKREEGRVRGRREKSGRGGLFPDRFGERRPLCPPPLRSSLAPPVDLRRACGPEQVFRYPPMECCYCYLGGTVLHGFGNTLNVSRAFPGAPCAPALLHRSTCGGPAARSKSSAAPQFGAWHHVQRTWRMPGKARGNVLGEYWQHLPRASEFLEPRERPRYETRRQGRRKNERSIRDFSVFSLCALCPLWFFLLELFKNFSF